MNRKGFELSINFIVMLILAIVVFGFGLYFTNTLFSKAWQIPNQLGQDEQTRIAELLNRGERFVIPISSQDVKSGQHAVFGIGLANVGTADKTFSLTISCTSGVYSTGETIPNACSGVANGLAAQSSYTLKPNEQKMIPVAVVVPGSKPKGTYIFTVNVLVNSAVDNSNYPPKQFYVNVV